MKSNKSISIIINQHFNRGRRVRRESERKKKRKRKKEALKVQDIQVITKF